MKNERTLYVMSQGSGRRKMFAGGAVFKRWGPHGKWVMTDCAPYLRKVIGKTPVAAIGDLLTEKGFHWRWL